MNPVHRTVLSMVAGILLAIPTASAQRPRKPTPAPVPAPLPTPVKKTESAPAPVLVPEWTAFRKRYPHHVQGVALSAPRADGSRVIVLAEPPPDTGGQDYLNAEPELRPVARIYRHTIGHDGWVKDLVAVLPQRTDEEWSDLCGRLNRRMFGTGYKAFVYEIPSAAEAAPVKGAAQLDLRVTSAEIEKWLLTDKMALEPIEGGAATTLAAALLSPTGGLYFSQESGLVIWALPDGVDMKARKREARQFALESDLVLGAISAGRGVGIVARERTVPVTELPPLRAETILQLAATGSYELAQSYERNVVFSGKFDGKRDWAPIYLSRQLIDTEYGSLLNITDQLLKSWSNAGETQYINFRYPNPGRYPFDKAVPAYLGVTDLTYNWNTKGTGYAINNAGHIILALNRTGALPVSYIPGDGAGMDAQAQKVMRAEDTAYDYFCGINDPNLVRVVQYAALYQCFTNLKIGAPPKDQEPDRVHPAVIEEMNRVYGLLKTKPAAELAEQAFPDLLKDLDQQIEEMVAKTEKKQKAKLDAAQRAQLKEISANARAKEITRLTGFINAAKAVVDQFVQQSGEVEGLNKFITTRRGEAEKTAGQDLQRLTDMVALREKLVAAGAAGAKGWIHTPTVVVSWNTVNGERITGGHNLGAGVTVLTTDATIVPGTIKLSGRKLLIHPDDQARVAEVIRGLGRFENDLAGALPKIEQALAASRVPLLRTPSGALGVSVRLPGNRGMRLADAPMPKGIEQGWSSRAATPAEFANLSKYRAAGDGPLVLIKKSPQGNEVFAAKGGEVHVVKARTHEDVHEVLDQMISEGRVVPGHDPVFVFENWTENEVLNFRRTADARAPGKRSIAIGSTGVLNPADVQGLLAQRFDFSAAKIQPAVIEPVQGVVPRTRATFQLNAPAVKGSLSFEPEMRATIGKTLNDTEVAELNQAVKEGVSSGGKEKGIQDFVPDIKESIRKHLQGTPVDLLHHLKRENLDIFISDIIRFSTRGNV